MLDFLKQNDVAVVLSRIHALPLRDGDDYDQAYKLPATLQQAGIRYCLDYEGSMETAGSRNLAFVAGTAAGYGLTKEQALTAVTLSPAQILGLDQDYGSLEAGKSATLVVSRGDLLDMRTNDLTHAYIDGRAFSRDNKQLYLRNKFAGKYGLPALSGEVGGQRSRRRAFSAELVRRPISRRISLGGGSAWGAQIVTKNN